MLDQKNYYHLEGFENVYLEDSFVLDIQEKPNQIIFIMDIVLTEKHPLYASPLENEQYCYKQGKIIFPGIKKVQWEDHSMEIFIDANEEYDYGNIDEFYVKNGCYYLSGDWGKITIKSPVPKLLLEL